MAFDPLASVRSVLLASSTLTTKVATRIYAGPRVPDGYDPEVDGSAIQFNIRGGSVSKELPMVSPSMQFRCWGASPEDAMDLYLVLRSVLHDKGRDHNTYGTINCSFEEQFGQPLIDPVTAWPFVLAYFSFTLSPP